MPGDDLTTRKLRRAAEAARRVLDLFAGCGGLSLGLVRAGFTAVGGVEREPHAAASYARNLHGGDARHAVARDITDPGTTPATLSAELGLGPVGEAIDVVAAGPPCQAFARVGRAKLAKLRDDPWAFLNDERAGLHDRWLAWIAAFRPLAVLVENVPDMLNLAGRNLADEIAGELAALGFRCRYTLLNAAHYGVPQARERLFLLGLRDGLGIDPSFPAATHRFDLPRGYESSRRVALRSVDAGGLLASPYWVATPGPAAYASPAVTAREALGDLPPITALKDGTSRRGPRRFGQPTGYSEAPSSAYARLVRAWPGLLAPLGGPRDHVVRHLPRDWPVFERMRAGDEYPAALRISKHGKRRVSQRGRSRTNGTSCVGSGPVTCH